MPGKAEKVSGGKLICETCGKPAKRLLSPPPPTEKGNPVIRSGLVCEECLAQLEKAYSAEEMDAPDAEQ